MRRVKTIVVSPGAATRLDVFLSDSAGLSRRVSRERIARGAVRVNGRPARKGQRLAAGDRVDLLAVPERATEPRPSLGMDILFEDADVVIVDKPAGLPSVGVRDSDRDTVASFLAARHPNQPGGIAEGGLVQRLDTDTSGVMIAGRTDAARRELRRQLRERSVRKVYLAVVHGDCAASGSVTEPVGHVPRRPRRMAVRSQLPRAARAEARQAITTYRPLRRFGIATLLEVSIETGVRHQIRVHLASIGHPIAGDSLYARGIELAGVPRLLLHAWRVRFRHPTSGRVASARAPVPPDMRDALRQLRRGVAPRVVAKHDPSGEPGSGRA